MSGYHKLIVKEAGIGEKLCVLCVESGHIVGVTVADVGDVVDTVQHLTSILFIEKLSFCMGKLKRMVAVVERQHWIQRFPPFSDYIADSFMIGCMG